MRAVPQTGTVPAPPAAWDSGTTSTPHNAEGPGGQKRGMGRVEFSLKFSPSSSTAPDTGLWEFNLLLKFPSSLSNTGHPLCIPPH